MGEADLRRIIAKVEDLPTLPRTVLRITELVNDPRASAKDLSIIITDDQVLTARLLKLVNSSFYGFPQPVTTVTGAIVLLGFDAIRNLLLTTSVLDLFPARIAKVRRDQEQLWDHSLACAIGAKSIGNFLRYDKLEELFVAGLLHDIGKIVEMMFLQDDFARITERVRDQGVLISTAEQDLLGCTHADIGRLLAERWNLPAKLWASSPGTTRRPRQDPLPWRLASFTWPTFSPGPSILAPAATIRCRPWTRPPGSC